MRCLIYIVYYFHCTPQPIFLSAPGNCFMSVNFIVKRSKKRRKTISLQIGKSSELIVHAPYFTPVSEIDRFVQEKQPWISKSIQKQAQALSQDRGKEYVTGEHFYYLGRSFPLEVFFEPFENAGVVFWNNCFYLNAPQGKEMRKHYFVSWYKKKARQFINERLNHLSPELGLHPRSIRITSARTRWGSCSGDDNLAFSFRLIMAPPGTIDYVIVHELMHMREKNHSSKFWKLVVEVMPHYKLHRRWLKDNQHRFDL
jgi:predicted metal-dependent hydrolase